MANGYFVNFRNNVWTPQTGFANVDFSADSIKTIFVDHADDTPVLATDQDMADIASAARVPAEASAATLGTKTIGSVAAGVFDAADTTHTALSGDPAESMLLYKDTGTEATSPLIYSWDTATGLPLTPNAGDVTIVWNASGILTS